ncbi:MAG: glycosyltransferase family 4 protein [Bacteroidales bacterium]|nr:glycosyltransferase family 4 protein [Bacteroidales bacterium]
MIKEYAIILALLIVGELVYFRIAKHFNIIDKPNARSSHTGVVLRGGGIVFLLGAWLSSAFFGLQYPWFMAGLTLIATVSFFDDVGTLPDSVRLIFQCLAIFLMFMQMGVFGRILWPVVLLAWVVGVGIINAYNFMDGINGITGLYSIAVLLPLMHMNAGLDQTGFAFISHDLLVAVLLSVLVFCFFNFRKRARCFAGDVGATSMAYLLYFAIFLLMIKTGDLTYIMFLAVYGVDTVLTIIHRIILHENLGEAHRKHAYQIMANELKIPHLLVAAFYFVLQLLISAGLIFLPINHFVYSGIVLVVLCLSYLIFMKKYYPLHSAYLESLKTNQQL